MRDGDRWRSAVGSPLMEVEGKYSLRLTTNTEIKMRARRWPRRTRMRAMRPSSESSPPCSARISASLCHASSSELCGPAGRRRGPQCGASSCRGAADGGRCDTEASPSRHRSLAVAAQASLEASAACSPAAVALRRRMWRWMLEVAGVCAVGDDAGRGWALPKSQASPRVRFFTVSQAKTSRQRNLC
jgi:hypothetical protein